MPWYLKFIAVGVAVTVAGVVAKRLGPFVGGMVLAFPFAIGSGLIFSAVEEGGDFRRTAVGALWGLVPLLVFLVVVVALAPRTNPANTLLVAVAAWVAVAVAVNSLR